MDLPASAYEVSMNILDDLTVQSKAVLGVSGRTEEVSAAQHFATDSHWQLACSEDFAGEQFSMHNVMMKIDA